MMKNFKELLSKIMLVAIALVVMSACEKDESEPDKPYVGEWESAVYPSFNTQGAPIFEKMVFTFTNNGFEDQIYQGESEDDLTLQVGMKGDIQNPSEGTMAVEINEISLQGGPYTDKTTDEISFYTKFNLTIGLMLYESFDAEYTINGDVMTLTLPAKNPMGGEDVEASLTLNRK